MHNKKSLVILSGLATATLVAAEGEMARLAPNDVPVECATICGPVVELTGICHIGSHDSIRRLKRRRVLERERREVHRRQFVTNAFGQLVPAPLPNGAKTVTQVITKTAIGAAAVATGLPPVAAGAIGDDGGDDDAAGLPPLAPNQMPVAVGNAVGGDSGSENLELADGSDNIMEDMHAQTHKKESDAIEKAEEDCICLNDSFQVPLVSALCSSCIQQSGDMNGPMNIIMAQCNFTEETYDPSRETAVFNVRVQASRPTVPPDASNALISDSPPSPKLQNGFMGAIVAGVACGIAMML